MLVILLACGVAILGNLGHSTANLSAFAVPTTASLPSAFVQLSSPDQDDMLLKPPAPETLLVNRPRQGIISHTVTDSESIASIADQYGISVNTIIWANGLDEDAPITTGQVLAILPVSGVIHKVKAGETIEDIAWKYQSDVRAIVEFNQLTDPGHLQGDDVLVVPGGRQEERQRVQLASRSMDRSADGSAESARQEALKPSTYQVQTGDSISEIADRFGVSQDTILAANGLTDPDKIAPGQELTVLPVSGALHVVREGESVGAIADRYGVDTADIVKANALRDADTVAQGQNLVIPGAKVASTAKPEQAPVQVASATHTVRAGESLRLIAEMYNVNPARIVEANNIADADVVVIGQSLIIPGGQGPAVAAALTSSRAPGRSSSGTVAAAPAPARASAPPPAPAVIAAPVAAPGSGNGWNIVSIASKYLGYRYAWGGASPAGFDCSGFVYYAYRAAGIPVPRDLWGQLQAGPRIKQANLQPGDIVFFENTYTAGLSHDGIYIGGGRFINAESERSGVKVSSLYDSYWAARYYAASRPW